MSFEHLLRPGRIGGMELRNRIVMSPMETMYGTPDGLPSERTVAYLAARAAGGVGLVTVGATGIDPLHPETPGGLHLGTDEAVAAHRRLTDAVHEHGARIQPQIVHAGPDGLGPEMHGVTSIGPSVIPSYLTGRPSVEATQEQIAEVLDLYRAAVVRARAAGYDGIELHAAHGYMFLGSFLAPQRNRRGDRYRGTSVEGRIRVVLEALAAIRGEVGPDFPITLRISGYERVAGGRPIQETSLVAPLLVEAGVDALPRQRWGDRPAGHADGQRPGRGRRGQRRCRGGGPGGGRRPGDRRGPAARPRPGRGGAGRGAGRLRGARAAAAGRPRPAPQAGRRAGRAGAPVHLLRELHRLPRAAILHRLRGQPAHRPRARAAPPPGAGGSARGRRRRWARWPRVGPARSGPRPPGDPAGAQRPARRVLRLGGRGAPRERAVPRLAAGRGGASLGRPPAGRRGHGCGRGRARAGRRRGRHRRRGGLARDHRPPAARGVRAAGRRRAARPGAPRRDRRRRPDRARAGRDPRGGGAPGERARARRRPRPGDRREAADRADGRAGPPRRDRARRRRGRRRRGPGRGRAPQGGSSRRLPVDDVVLAGVVEPDTGLVDDLVALLPAVPVHAVGDCTGLGLLRGATADAATAIDVINRSNLP